MSALRDQANDDNVLWPFVSIGSAFLAVLDALEELRTDAAAMEDIEGGPQQPADVPGAGGDA